MKNVEGLGNLEFNEGCVKRDSSPYFENWNSDPVVPTKPHWLLPETVNTTLPSRKKESRVFAALSYFHAPIFKRYVSFRGHSRCWCTFPVATLDAFRVHKPSCSETGKANVAHCVWISFILHFPISNSLAFETLVAMFMPCFWIGAAHCAIWYVIFFAHLRLISVTRS